MKYSSKAKAIRFESSPGGNDVLTSYLFTSRTTKLFIYCLIQPSACVFTIEMNTRQEVRRGMGNGGEGSGLVITHIFACCANLFFVAERL